DWWLTWPLPTKVGQYAQLSIVVIPTVKGGTVTVTGISNSSPGEFVMYSNTCPTPGSWAPEISCQISFAFRPAAAGSRSAVVQVFTSNANNPIMRLNGTGTP